MSPKHKSEQHKWWFLIQLTTNLWKCYRLFNFSGTSNADTFVSRSLSSMSNYPIPLFKDLRCETYQMPNFILGFVNYQSFNGQYKTVKWWFFSVNPEILKCDSYFKLCLIIVDLFVNGKNLHYLWIFKVACEMVSCIRFLKNNLSKLWKVYFSSPDFSFILP